MRLVGLEAASGLAAMAAAAALPPPPGVTGVPLEAAELAGLGGRSEEPTAFLATSLTPVKAVGPDGLEAATSVALRVGKKKPGDGLGVAAADAALAEPPPPATPCTLFSEGPG